jgi:hypothetical protein
MSNRSVLIAPRSDRAYSSANNSRQREVRRVKKPSKWKNRKCKCKYSRLLIGAPAGIRTPNQQIMSLLL